MNKSDTGILFPRAFAFAIDDLGWNDGSNLSESTPSGPHRAGVKRTFSIRDYQYIVDVGKAVGVRVQCLFILSEMDRENILAKYPTTTWQREKWNNSFRVNETQHEIMKYVLESAAHMEFGLHGTGHEWWADDGIQRRAEWYNLKDRAPWPEETVRDHINAFKQIMAQYGMTAENGHSFPESFVPCAYSYYWNPGGDYSLGKLLSEAGVKYANTDFAQIPELNPPNEINGGGFDFGTHVINRLNYGNLWYELNKLPEVKQAAQETDIIESHWPNWLAQDDFLQPEVTQNWIEYYLSFQRMPERYIAKNTEQLHAQWLYNKYTRVHEPTPGIVTIDNTAMPTQAYAHDVLGNMVLKVKLPPGSHVSRATLDGASIPAYLESEGYGFLYLPVLQQENYELQYSISAAEMPFIILNDGTYNVYGIQQHGNAWEINLKMYGTQKVKFRCGAAFKSATATDGLKINDSIFDPATGVMTLSVSAHNVQGKRGILRIA